MPARAYLSILVAISCVPRCPAETKSWLFVSLQQDRNIAVYERDGSSGRLSLRNACGCSAEPGVLCTSPDKKTLFVSLKSTGQLASFSFHNKTGTLVPINTVSGGDDPAYLLVDHSGRYLLCAYYVANKVTVHEISAEGAIAAEPLQTLRTADKAHAIELDSTNRMAFVPHTGSNRIYQLRFDERSGRLTPSVPAFVDALPGQEPRHVAIHPSDRWAYANNEAGDSLSVYDVDRTRVTLTQVQTISTLPDGFDGDQNSTARCEMTRDGRFIYVANRGHNSIAGFSINQRDGRISSLGQWATERTPRSFTISPDGQFLHAAGQGSGRVVTYRIGGDGRLGRLHTIDVGPVPWCVLAIDIKGAD